LVYLHIGRKKYYIVPLTGLYVRKVMLAVANACVIGSGEV